MDGDDRRQHRRDVCGELDAVTAFVPIGAIAAFTTASQLEFAAASSTPTPTRKNLINQLIVRLKAAGWWDGMDGCCIVDFTSPTPAFQNWRNTQVGMNIQNTPDLVADAGSQGDGVSAEGPRTFWNPSTASGRNMTATSMFMAVFCLNDSTIAGYDLGCASSLRLSASWTDGQMRANMGTGTGLAMAVPSSAGFRGAFREGQFVKLVSDDVISAWLANTSGALANANLTMGFVSTAVSDRREFGAFWGACPANLTDAKITELVDAITEYFLAVNGNYEISCTITDPTGATTVVPYRVFHNGVVPLNGTMIGTSLDIEARITASSDPSTVIVAYTDVDTTVSTGPWSGVLTGVPVGSNYKANARLSDLSATSPRTFGNFGVGFNFLMCGDSSMVRDWTITDISPADTAGDKVRRFSGTVYNGNGTGGWPVNSAAQNGGERGGPYGGDGARLIGNELSAALPTWSFGFVQLAYPGTSLSQWTDGGEPLPNTDPPFNMWESTDYSLTSANSKGAPGWSQIGMVLDSGGINDADLPGVSAATWEATADQRLADLRTETGNAALPWCITACGSSEGSPNPNGIQVSNASVNAVRQGELAFWDANKTDEVYIICGNVVAKRADQVGHPIALHQRYIAKLRARTMLYVLGQLYSLPLADHPACGPQIVSVAVTGNSFVVTCAHEGGTLLQGDTADTGLTGSELIVDGTVRAVLTCEILSATTYGGTFDGAAATSTALYRYLYGALLDGQIFDDSPTPTVVFVPNYIFDNDEVYTDAFPGIPLQPSRDTEGDGWMAATVT